MSERLEEMGSFFDARIDTYEQHMFEEVDGADEYYEETARRMVLPDGGKLLDLGCGSGLELDEIWKRQPDIRVKGIDLSREMLALLLKKHPDKEMELVLGSYFTEPFGTGFDGAVSVQTMHHFTHEQKLGLYRKILEALKPGGWYVETDYVAECQEQEDFFFSEYARLKEEQGLTGEEGFFHYDTPCTVENQQKLLRQAGFQQVELCWRKKNTGIFLAQKPEE
ncbi:MAG: class I SAM-dependent methyltransferase [Massiliimalia sp.]|jgi:tRNA (cmo5U34)-methyltransferase